MAAQMHVVTRSALSGWSLSSHVCNAMRTSILDHRVRSCLLIYSLAVSNRFIILFLLEHHRCLHGRRCWLLLARLSLLLVECGETNVLERITDG